MPKIVDSINSTKKEAIGNLRPSLIISPLQDPQVEAAIEKSNQMKKESTKVPSIHTRQERQAKYEGKSNELQVDDYVYADFKRVCSLLNLYILLARNLSKSCHFPGFIY